MLFKNYDSYTSPYSITENSANLFNETLPVPSHAMSPKFYRSRHKPAELNLSNFSRLNEPKTPKSTAGLRYKNINALPNRRKIKLSKTPL